MGSRQAILVFVAFIAIYGCSSGNITFEHGVKKINEMNEKFGSTMKTPPNSEEKINALLAEITAFSIANKNKPKELEYMLDFRIKSLEAEKLHVEGWKWGRGSTTDYGFGCKKGSERIMESAKLRNNSAQKGYEAVSSLQLLVQEFPDKAKSLNLSQKDILFLNATYYQIEKKARTDRNTISSICANSLKQLNGK